MRTPIPNTFRTIYRFALCGALVAASTFVASAQTRSADMEEVADACEVEYTFTAPDLDKFQDDTTSMLKEIHNRLASISKEAALLQVYASHPSAASETYAKHPSTPSQKTHSTKLTLIKEAANEVADQVCKLRARKYLQSAWQRDITEELAASANTLNLHIANAIEQLNQDRTEEQLFFGQYDESIDQIYEISSRLERRTQQFLNYGEWKSKQS